MVGSCFTSPQQGCCCCFWTQRRAHAREWDRFASLWVLGGCGGWVEKAGFGKQWIRYFPVSCDTGRALKDRRFMMQRKDVANCIVMIMRCTFTRDLW